MASRITRRSFVKGVTLAAGGLVAATVRGGAGGGSALGQSGGPPGLPPGYPLPVGYPALPLYEDALRVPPVYAAQTSGSYPGADYYEVGMFQYNAQLGVRDLHRRSVATPVLGFGGVGPTFNPKFPASYPGATFEATAGRPTVVKWVNNLPQASLFPVDHSVHGTYDMGTGPGTPFPLRLYPDTRVVVHLHGALVAHESDGWPKYWFSSDPTAPPNTMTMPDGTQMSLGGPAGNSAVYQYFNNQNGSTLWYHDHALGTTRFNVYGGLAGFYLLRDEHEMALIASRVLPPRSYEIPLLIQDRTFNIYRTDSLGGWILNNKGNPIVDPTVPGYGSLHYNEVPTEGEPEWMPEMFCDTALVNGRIRPYLNVERRTYRFRVLNGCQARVLTLHLEDPFGVQAPPAIVQIGSDGGLMPKPAMYQQPGQSITVMSSERDDFLIDFSACTPGSSFVLLNTAAAPYPDGGAQDAYGYTIPPVTDIMQFRIQASAPMPAPMLPSPLAPKPTVGPSALTRNIGLNDFGGTQMTSGFNGLLINNVSFDVASTIKPVVGTTEIWRILNLAPDTHPIHLHLAAFIVLGRMPFIGPSIDDDIDPTQPVYPHPLDPKKPYAPLRWGGVKQFLFDNDLAEYDPVAQDIGYDAYGNQLLLNGGLGYRSGRAGMSGKFWDPTGADPHAPTTPLTPPPIDIKVHGQYLYLNGQMLPPDPNETGWKDTVRADKNYVTIIKKYFYAPEDVSFTDPVTNELIGARFPIHCHILDHEDNDMMSSFALQPEGTPVQHPRV